MKFTTRIRNAVEGFAGQRATNDLSGRQLANDFLRNGGNSRRMVQDWSQVEMSDQDMYTGYSYAAIRKRANRASALGKKFLQTEASDAIQEGAKKKGTEIEHPYLTLVRDSKEFSQRKFWHDISTYLDLEGVYYLMAVRAVGQNKDGSTKVGSIQKFVMMNPYNVRRILKGSTNELGGYLEAINGQYREIPKEMVIEIRLLNPFDNDLPYSMTDAAKESQFTLKQAGDYTRHSIQGNTNAPGAITTDVQLDDAIFDNFVSRIQNHSKGEPLYGNGAGAINWQSMQIDLDKAALDKINEIHRSILFAVSGTSKTTLGIEESGTTRDTSQVQKDNFTEDAVMPQIEDIIDALNLDYRKWYPEWEKDKYEIVLDNPLETNREAELSDIEIRERELEVRESLVAMGYEYDIAAKYAHGEITLEELGEPTLEEEITPEQADELAAKEAGFNPDPQNASAEPEADDKTAPGRPVPALTKTNAGVGERTLNKFVRKEDNDKTLKEARKRLKDRIKTQKDEARAKKQAEKDQKKLEKEQKDVPVVLRPEAPLDVVPKAIPAVEPQVNGLQVVKFNNQLASRDIPTLYDGLGIDFDKLGCIMLNTTKIPVAQYIKDAGDDMVENDRGSSLPGETEPHVTLLFGLLQNGNVWKEKVDSVLETWGCKTVTINRVSFFDLGDSYAIVGIVNKSEEIVDGHERLTLLPHINTFSEYIPHITLAYVKHDDEIRDKWVFSLNKRYEGQMVQTRGINYGDLPEETEDSESPDPKANNHVEDEHDMENTTEPLMGLADITDQEMLDAGFIQDEDGDWIKGPNYVEPYLDDDDEYYDDDIEAEPRPKRKEMARNSREAYVEYHHSHDSLEDDSYINSTIEKATNALEDDYRDRVILGESELTRATQAIEAEMVQSYILAVSNGDFSEARRILTASEAKKHENDLKLALTAFFTLLYPVYAQNLFRERAAEFEKQGIFAMTNEIEKQIRDQASKGAESHINTIIKDLDKAIVRAMKNEIEQALITIIRGEAQAQNQKVLKKLPANFNDEDIAKAVKLGKFDVDNELYRRARQLAREGNGLDSITRALRKEYENISRNRARTIARHETNRVFNMAQYQADLQFLKEANMLGEAFKVLKNRADDPCPICEKMIEESRANPIPFQKNFADLGDTIRAQYTSEATGKQLTMKLPVNYEAITAGNVHVNCRCEYELLVKQADGSFLNAVDHVVKNYSPTQARDEDGQWTDGGGGGSVTTLETLNPSGGIFVGYNPEARAKAPLGKNITTLAETTGQDPDKTITIYRGAPKSQSDIVPGDFITDSKQLAMDYGADAIISKEVRLGDILDDKTESEGGEYIYRPGADEELKKRDENGIGDKIENKYNPSQARDEDGQWTDGGGGGHLVSVEQLTPNQANHGKSEINGDTLELSTVDKKYKFRLNSHEKQLLEGGLKARFKYSVETTGLRNRRGQYDNQKKEIELNVAGIEGDSIKTTFYHEMGHAIDINNKGKRGWPVYQSAEMKGITKKNPLATFKKAIASNRIDEAVRGWWGLPSTAKVNMSSEQYDEVLKGKGVYVDQNIGGKQERKYVRVSKNVASYMQASDELFAEGYAMYRLEPSKLKTISPQAYNIYEEITQ